LENYPLTPDEAFMASQFDSFITADLVMQARKEEVEPYGPLLIGVDPAGMGDDATAIASHELARTCTQLVATGRN
jgi:hypothetical protein